jgi:DHA3 family macrolide efflux protein-like MFS transporter
MTQLTQSPRVTIWNRNFSILWAGLVQSYLGDAFLTIGLMWLVLEMTDSPASAATVVALGGIPKLFGPLAGVFVDRVSKRKLMIGSDLIRGALLVGVFALHLTGLLCVWHLYLIVIVLGMLSIIYGPALRILLPALVPDDRLPAANSTMQASLQVSTIVGTSLAGAVLAGVGAPIALLIDGVSFLVAAVVLWFVRFPGELCQAVGLEMRKVLGDTLGGLRFIVSAREVLTLTLLAFFLNLVLSPINIILPIFSENVLGAGVMGFGFLASAISLGILLGNVIAGIVGDRVPYARSIVIGLLGMAATLAGLSLIQSMWLALAAIAGLGMTAPFIQVPAVTHLQRSVPQKLQGRVFATWEALVTLSTPIAATLVGHALLALPVTLIFQAAALGILPITALWIWAATAKHQPAESELLETA